MTAFALAALGVSLIAVITDVRTRRIPNLLTFGGASVGLLAHGAVAGWAGLGSSAAGWALGCALFLPFFLLGGMGAGDVKLVAAIGAWLGPGDAFWVAVFGSIAGGILAIGVAVAHGYLWTAVRNVRNLVVYWALVGPKPMPALTLERSEAPRLAYAIPIFCGAAVTVWLR